VRTGTLRFSSIGVGSRVKFSNHYEAIFHDTDGTLTGTPRGWLHSASDTGTIGHFPPAHCALSNLGSSRGQPGVSVVCGAGTSLRTFRWRHVNPQATFEGRDAVISTPFGSSAASWMVYDILIRRSSHHFTIATGSRHRVDWMPNMQFPTDHEGWSAGEVCELRADEYAVLEVPTLTNPLSWDFEGNRVEYPASLGSLEALPEVSRLGGFFQYQRATVGTNGASVNGNLQMLLSPRKAPIVQTNRVETRVPGIGGWGGTCTCPDGQVYQGSHWCSNRAQPCRTAAAAAADTLFAIRV
jgi:hypothetical protein